MNTFGQLAHRALTDAELLCYAHAKHHTGVLGHLVEHARGAMLESLLADVEEAATRLREALILANQVRECLIALPEDLTDEVMPMKTILLLADTVSKGDWEASKQVIVLTLTKALPPHVLPDEDEPAPTAPAAQPAADDFEAAAAAADDAEPLPPPAPSPVPR